MKFIIDGTEYEGAALERITGRHALDLAKYAKVGVASLATRLDELQRLTLDEDDAPILLPEGETAEGDQRGLALFASPPHLRALLALIWMSRRLNGKEFNLSWEEVLDMEILQVGFRDDDADDEEPEPEEAPDPSPPSASDPGAGGKAPASRRTSKASTTSTAT